MPEKDFREKRLEDFDDVFADIINGLIFNGQKRVDENDLDSGMLRSGFKIDGKFEEQERDVKKYWKSSLNLKDHLVIPKGMEKYLPDYKVNLFEIAYLSDEQIKNFKSDFRYVAEYFAANRKRREGQKPKLSLTLDHIKHVEELKELMNAITNSDRFSSLPKLAMERGGDSMLTILFDEAEERGEKRGEKRGKIIGEKKGKIIASIEIYREEMKLSPEEITNRIMSRYGLEKNAAQKYVQETLGLAN